MNEGRWAEKEAGEDDVAAHMACGRDRIVSRLLAVRHISVQDAEAFFHPCDAPLSGHDALPGACAAADTILAHITARDKIAVFGDYDCDGVCATAILCKTIEMLGGDVTAFLPDRLSEGYGMTEASLTRFKRENPLVRLVITVDNGINSVDAVAEFAAHGVETVVTDHHLPGRELPHCTVVNPHVGAGPGQEWLCGAGVAFAVANALVHLAKERASFEGAPFGAPLLVLAGIATVADLMPLCGQNRVLVAKALALFDRCAPAGVKELFQRAARTAGKHTAKDFGFLIGPRLNACGRMGSAADALALVREADREKARFLAIDVDRVNSERKNVEKAMFDRAVAQIVPGAAAQTIDLGGGHAGVAGIVAARVLDSLRCSGARPVPVCIVVDGKGSARASEGYNVRDALASCGSDAVERFGGHAAAAGVTVRAGAFALFRERFAAACAAQAASLPPEMFEQGAVDAWIDWSELTTELVERLSSFEPFGEGNPEPVFAIRRAMLSEVRSFGQDGRHLQFVFAGPRRMRGVWWGMGAAADAFRKELIVPHDIMFNAVLSDFGGERHVELRIVLVRLSR